MGFKISSLIILLLLLLSGNIFSQVTTQWNSVYNGAANDTDIVTSMTVDIQGNVYVTGFSKGYFTGRDISTIKYNSSGQQLWVSRYNNTDGDKDDAGNAIAVDASGNVYVTGYTTGTDSFKDYIILKYSVSGELLWKVVYNGDGNDDDIAYSISVTGLGFLYVTGSSVGLNTSEDFLTIKYNSAGAELWISSYNNPEMDDIDIANCMAVDATGNIIIAGYSIGKGSQEDFATVKYNASGEVQWVNRFNGNGNGYDITSGLTVDASGNVVVTGYSLGKNSSEDYATVKYDSLGKNIWENIYNGSSNSYDISTAISSDVQGNIYVTGYSFDELTAENYTTVKYSPSGNLDWVAKFNGEADDFDIATSVKADNKGDVYVTGYSFDINTQENYATVKYNSSGVEQWTEIYNGSSNGSDISAVLLSDVNDNIYVTGYSYDGPNSVDYVTIKYSQTVGINENAGYITTGFELKQNYPNPFNPVTVISYKLSGKNNVSLRVYDILGNEITTLVDQKQNPGTYSIQFDAKNYPSGTYFYKLQADKYSETRRMLLLK